MRAVWARARSELRSHRRALVALCLLAGLPGGVAVAAAIGASRTDTVMDRTIRAEDPTDIFYPPDFQETKIPFDRIAALPIVSAAYVMHGYTTMNPGLEKLELSVQHEVALPARFFKLLDGRLPDPGRADEVMISFRARDFFHWHVGSRVTLILGAPPSDPNSNALRPGPVATVRIVGIEAAAGDLVGVAGPGMMATPAFDREYASRSATYELDTFKLRHGHTDVLAFDAAIHKLSGGDTVLYTDIVSDLNQVKRSFHLQALALWLTCAALGGVSLLIFGQSISRQASLSSDEYPSLHALGMTRGELMTLGMIRAAIIAIAASTLAVTSAILLSLATPFGLARVIEPSPGVWMPVRILSVGVGVLAVFIVASAALPSWRAASLTHRERLILRPSIPARILGFLTRRPSLALGSRFALEQGRGRGSVPVRSSLIAAVAGIVVLLATLSVGVSVKHFVATPRLYGWTWDVAFDSGGGVSFESGSKARQALIDDPAIADASVGVINGATFRLNHVAMDGIAMDAIKGHLEPNVLEGRSPVGLNEIAVGRKSLQQAGAHLGSTVSVTVVPGGEPISMRVVGVAVFPFDDDTSTVGEGLWMTAEALNRIIPVARRDSATIRFAPGVSKKATLQRLRSEFAGDPSRGEGFIEAQAPGGVTDYRRVSQVPLILAGLLAALAAGTLTHLLVSSIRRRRRDIAILKTLGLATAQARAVVLWQAGIFTTVALAIAVPFGVVVGRWMWAEIARYGGFDPAPVVPLGQFGIVCGGAVAVALVIAILPARAAARTPAAVVLRTE